MNKASSVSGIYKKAVKYKHERRHIASASSALVIAAVLGLAEALLLIVGAKPILIMMGLNRVNIFVMIFLRFV